MKKTLAFIASLVLMTAAFASCGKIDDDEAAEKGTKNSSSVDKSDDDDEDDEDDDKKSSKKDKDDEDDGDDDKKSSKKDKDDEDDDDDKKSSEKDKDDEDDDDDKKSSKKDKDDDDDDSKPSKKSDNDIKGIWLADDAAMAEIFDMDDDFNIESMTFEVTESEIKLTANVDMSGMFCIQGDKFIMDGESLSYDYDGNVISFTLFGELLVEFKRVGKADKDNVYGRYTCDEMFGTDEEEGEIFFDFPEDNVAYMVMSMAIEYSYDEETGKLTVTDMDGEAEDMDVEISGDKMYMTDEDGEQITFIRKK